MKKKKTKKSPLDFLLATEARFQISDFVKEDLLDGKAVYIRKKKLYFSGIRITGERLSFLVPGDTGDKEAVSLAISEGAFNDGNTLTIQFAKGDMRLSLD